MSILFFHFDGTDNEPQNAADFRTTDRSISNVLKSHLLLGGRAHIRASLLPHGNISFYYSGVGTYGSWLEGRFNAGFAFESGHIATILNYALQDFKNHFNRDVQYVVLIGFSRGAALARRFAALLEPLLDASIVIEAVMDTVSSIGWPNLTQACVPSSEVVFEYGCTVPSCVDKALHLVALDEQRLAFRPTLMNADKRILEIWLPGVHSDVGGGYRFDGLADISLAMMTSWLESVLACVCYHSLNSLSSLKYWQYDQLVLASKPNPFGRIHYQRRSKIWHNLTLAPRGCHVLFDGYPCSERAPIWHTSTYERMAYFRNYKPIAIYRVKPKCYKEVLA